MCVVKKHLRSSWLLLQNFDDESVVVFQALGTEHRLELRPRLRAC